MKSGSGACATGSRRQHQRLQRAFVDQSVDHAGRDAGFLRGIAPCARHAVGEQVAARARAPPSCAAAAGRRAARRRARAPGRDARPCAAPCAAPCRARRACSPRPSRRIGAAPAQRRHIELARRRPSAGYAGRGAALPLAPDHAGIFARARAARATKSPGASVNARRHAVGIGAGRARPAPAHRRFFGHGHGWPISRLRKV